MAIRRDVQILLLETEPALKKVGFCFLKEVMNDMVSECGKTENSGACFVARFEV